MRKSYHSMVVPMALAAATERMDAGLPWVCSVGFTAIRCLLFYWTTRLLIGCCERARRALCLDLLALGIESGTVAKDVGLAVNGENDAALRAVRLVHRTRRPVHIF